MKTKRLSPSEELVMNLFWSSDTSLTGRQVLERAEGMSWSINYVHKVLSLLLERQFLEICGVTREGTHYTRFFSPTLTKEEYCADLLHEQDVNLNSLIKIAVALVKKTSDQNDEEHQNQLIAELETMIADFESQGGDGGTENCK